MKQSTLFDMTRAPPVFLPEYESNERYTPPHVLDVVMRVGDIALDPCTTPDNRTKAVEFCCVGGRCGIAADWRELAPSWAGLTFVNPPYGRSFIGPWCAKIAAEAARGCEIITLVTSDLGTRWGTLLFGTCDAIAFWRGRIPFVTPDGASDAGHKKPSAFFYFGDRAARFARAFAPHANVIVRGDWK